MPSHHRNGTGVRAGCLAPNPNQQHGFNQLQPILTSLLRSHAPGLGLLFFPLNTQLQWLSPAAQFSPVGTVFSLFFFFFFLVTIPHCGAAMNRNGKNASTVRVLDDSAVIRATKPQATEFN